MAHSPGLMLPTAVDLLALTTCIGALSCRLWVLPPRATTMDEEHIVTLWAALWRLLMVCLLLLTLSTLGELIGRTMTMSGLPLAASLRVLPTVLLRTHYGQVWFVRVAPMGALWLGWGVGRSRLPWRDCFGVVRSPSRMVPAVMLGAAALLALTRSASGHAADWGDMSLPELMDGLHLLAGSLWGGGLLVLVSTVLPVLCREGRPSSWVPSAHAVAGDTIQRRTLLADIARRFSVLASLALVVVLVSGIYNAWQQVGTVQALGTTPYGRMLLAKLLLVLPLLILGALNHYLGVPLLQQWAGRPLARQRLLHALVMRWYVRSGRRTLQVSQVVSPWQRRVRAEGLCVAGVLLCTAVLIHGIPPHQAAHPSHGQTARPLGQRREAAPWQCGAGEWASAWTGSLPGELRSKLADGKHKIGRAIPFQEHLVILVPQKCRARHTARQDEQGWFWPVWEHTTIRPAYPECLPGGAGFAHLVTRGRYREPDRQHHAVAPGFALAPARAGEVICR